MAKYLSMTYEREEPDYVPEEPLMREKGLDFLNIHDRNQPEDDESGHHQPEDGAPDVHQLEDDQNHFFNKTIFRCFRRSKATTMPTKIDLEEEMTEVAGKLRIASNYAQNLHVFNNLKEPVVLELHPWRRQHAQADSESV